MRFSYENHRWYVSKDGGRHWRVIKGDKARPSDYIRRFGWRGQRDMDDD